ncbi:MAG: type II toxin-antitoxin system RelE/ParE family toxin [Actinobacteria bacterium]|nr:type II toxin-antitoxin system RelE/ParE family toxin [Actinomycetota bacterium]
MTYRVVFTPEAEDHLKDLYRYIVDAAAPQIAAGYVDKVITYGEGLAEFPHRGLARDDIRASLRITSYKKRTVVAFAVLTPPITICRQNWVRRSWTMPPGCADSPACCGADTTGHPPTPPEPCGRLRRTSSRPAVPQNRSTDRSPATPRIWSTECHRAEAAFTAKCAHGCSSDCSSPAAESGVCWPAPVTGLPTERSPSVCRN